jgi:hypothetical protein
VFKILTRASALLVTAVVALVAACSPAEAGTFEQWRFRNASVICVVDDGSPALPVGQAVAAWDASAAVTLVRDSTCAAYPRSQVVDVVAYNDSAEYACAKTASPSGYDWVYVYYPNGTRKASWVPRDMTIWVNVAPERVSGCFATDAMKLHVIAHEVGHALGLGHPDGEVDSLMQDWSVQLPTAWDMGNLATVYGLPTTSNPTRTALPTGTSPKPVRR